MKVGLSIGALVAKLFVVLVSKVEIDVLSVVTCVLSSFNTSDLVVLIAVFNSSLVAIKDVSTSLRLVLIRSVKSAFVFAIAVDKSDLAVLI